MKALWGYISDKLNIPVSRLSKDNVEEKLRNYGVSDELIKEFLDALKNAMSHVLLLEMKIRLWTKFTPPLWR